MNQVNLIGNVGQKPEFGTINSGMELVRFSLATNRSWKDKEGERQTVTQWHNVVFWGKQAAVISKFVDKGHRLQVTGEIEYQTWDKDDGTKGYKTVINGRSFEFLEKKGSTSSSPEPTPPNGSQPATAEDLKNWEKDLTPDDLPF